MLWRTFLKSLWQNGKEKSDMLEVKFYDTVDDFTFEPHISFPDSKYGYKKENIYYFDENGLMEL